MNRLSRLALWAVVAGAAWALGWVSCFAMGLVANKHFQPRVSSEVSKLVGEWERGVVDA